MNQCKGSHAGLLSARITTRKSPRGVECSIAVQNFLSKGLFLRHLLVRTDNSPAKIPEVLAASVTPRLGVFHKAHWVTACKNEWYGKLAPGLWRLVWTQVQQPLHSVSHRNHLESRVLLGDVFQEPLRHGSSSFWKLSQRIKRMLEKWKSHLAIGIAPSTNLSWKLVSSAKNALHCEVSNTDDWVSFVLDQK